MSDAGVHRSPMLQALQEAMPALSPALRKVGEYLLRHPLLAATQNIEALAEAADASPAAVNRLANTLGYQGFTALRAELTQTLQAAVSPVDKLRGQIEHDQGQGVTLARLLAVAADNLAATAARCEEVAIGALADRLVAARKVFVLGFGNSTYLAGWAAANLAPYCDAIVASAEGGNENAAYKLAMLRPGDVVLAISLPRYSRDTVQLARFAADQGAHVVAVTDSPASPLAAIAHESWYVEAAHPLLSASGTAVLGWIEGLVSIVMLRNRQAVALSAQLSESMLDYLYADYPVTVARKKGV